MKQNMSADTVDLLSGLNPEQKTAVTSIGAPLLVIAGAGSGKTRVITYRIARLIQTGIAPWNILAVTFTNKAAGEMKARIKKLLGREAGLNIGTFHAICVRILRNEAVQLGLKANFLIYDGSDQMTLLRHICKDLNLCKKTFRPGAVAEKISAAKNWLKTPDIYRRVSADYYTSKIADIYTEYHKRLRKNNALDFDDLIMNTVTLFTEKQEILFKYQDKFKHILVDEYQDTNHAQYRLIRLLAETGQNLCVVGDPDQSIYGWRGADLRNILMFENDYPEARVIRLEQNYRSTQNILKAANSVIINNSRRKHKNLWSAKAPGQPITIYNAADEHAEANFAVKTIEYLSSQDAGKYSDIAIFYRMHAQSRVFEDGLRFAGIPYNIVGGLSFYERKEVKDVIAYLNILICPDCEVSMKRIINTPGRGLGKGALEIISRTAKQRGKTFNQTIWDSAAKDELPPKILGKVRDFVLLLSALREKVPRLPLSGLIRDLLDKVKYFDELNKEEKIIAESRIENVKELVSAAEEYSRNSERADLSGFLEGIALISDIDIWKDTAEKVTLMTLHAAKGLEFENVIMAGMEEGVFPHINSLTNKEQYEEERRLCYVGMTRAKSKLFMCYADQRMIYGRTIDCAPSAFLLEIPYDLQEIAGDPEYAEADNLII